MKKIIKKKRIYEEYNKNDGTRILVDRLWPRGMKKEDAKIDLWMKEIAPSNDLRKWYAHDPGKWEGFKKKYIAELTRKKDLCEEIIGRGKKTITLLYAAKDEEHNNAVALKEYLQNNFL